MSTGTISNNLRSLRFEAGEMTQQELADRADITRQTVISIEGGKYAPSLEVAFRLSRVFGLGVEVLPLPTGDPEAPEDLQHRRVQARLLGDAPLGR